MKVCVRGRMSGKSTEAKQILLSNPNAICFVPNVGLKTNIYGKFSRSIIDRVFTIHDNSWRGKYPRPSIVIIDEMIWGHDELYKNIERALGIDYIFTTPVKSKWLKEKIYDYNNEYHRMPSSEKVRDNLKYISKSTYIRQILAKPVDMDALEWEKFWDHLISGDYYFNANASIVDTLNQELKKYRNSL